MTGFKLASDSTKSHIFSVGVCFGLSNNSIYFKVTFDNFMLMFTFKDFIYGDSLDPLLDIGMNDRVSIKLIT